MLKIYQSKTIAVRWCQTSPLSDKMYMYYKGNGVSVHQEQLKWVRVHHEKSNGVRVHHSKNKEQWVRVHHKKKTKNLSNGGESSP